MVVVNSPTLVDNNSNDYCLLNSSFGGVNNLHNNNNINNTNNYAQNLIYNASSSPQTNQQRPQPQTIGIASTNSNYYAGIYARHEFIDLPAAHQQQAQQTYVQTLMPLSASGSLAAATLHNQPHHHIAAAGDYSYPPPPPSSATLSHQQGLQTHLHQAAQQPYSTGNFLPPYFDNGQQQTFSGGSSLISADGSTISAGAYPSAMFTATAANVHPSSFVPVHHQNAATLIVNGGAPTVGTAVNINFHQNHTSAPHIIGDLYQKHNGIAANTLVYTSSPTAGVFDSSDAGSGGSMKERSLPTSAASDTTTSSNNSSTGGGNNNCNNKLGGNVGKNLKNKQRKSSAVGTAGTPMINNSPSTSKSADSANDMADGSSGYLVESIDSGLAADNSSPEHHARCSSASGVSYHAAAAIAPPIYGGVGSADGSYGMSTNHTSSGGCGANRSQDSSAGGRNRAGVTNIVGQPVGNGPSGSGCGGGGSNGGSRTSSPPALVDNAGSGAPAIGPHAVYVHVNPGETLSVRVGNDIQHIPGPATVRMVSSHDSAPPVPLPLHVPPGHIVQQIVDESGVLRHLILSPQTPPITAGPFPCRNIPSGPLGPNVQYVPVQNGHHEGLTPPNVPAGSLAHSPPPYFPQLPLHTEPHHVCQVHLPTEDPSRGTKELRIPRGLPKKRPDMFPPGDDHDPADVTMDDNTSAATSGGTEDEEITKIAEMLSKIQPPQVCDIGPRDALVQWQPLDCSEASASGGPFPQIDASEFTYEAIVYERGEIRNNYRCQADQSQQLLCDLKPSTEYFVRLRALLEERGLNGEPSSAVGFKTKPTHPDKPLPPRLTQRLKTSVVLRWIPPCENGSRITGYHLEIDDSQQNVAPSSSSSSSNGGGGDACFREVFFGLNKQFKVHKLQPSTLYRFRLAASNQHGKSEFSDVLLVQTAGAAPQTPDPPQLVQTTSHSLTLAWTKRDGDEEFELLMEDPLSGHGFLPVCLTQDTSYVVPSLQKNKEYRFRLCVSNEEGRSLQSEVLTCRTLPGRPQAPNRPSAKGKVSSNNAKISWEPPKDTGGGEIIGYRLEFDDGTNGANWTEIYDGVETEHLVAGLQPGVSYKFRVACVSLGGQSSFSDPSVVCTSPIPPGVCRPPSLHGKPKSNSVHLKWSSPDTIGGSDITEYEVNMEWSESPFSRQTPCIVYHGVKTECVVGSLSPGRCYGFRVRAHNKAGIGHWSEAFECQTGAAPPEPPQNLRCIFSQSTCLHLQWDAPASCNGSPVLEYRLQQASRKVVSLQVPTVLPTGSVVSNNGLGLSSSIDDASSSVIQSSSCSTSSSSSSPSTSSTPTALMSNVAFAELEYGPFVQIYAGSNLIHEARGLSPANDYAFRVQAVNSAGISKFSPTFVVRTPPGQPDAPSNLSTETISTSEICVYWDSPCDNGSALLGFNLDVQPAPDDTMLPIQLPAYCNQHVVENLKAECTYRFRIQALNDVAAGPYSSSVRASTFSRPPSPPFLEMASASYNSLKLKWSEPPKMSTLAASSSSSLLTNGNGGGSPTETFTYTVEMENKIGAFSPVFDGTARSCKVPRLAESTLYRFRIRACASTGGVGPWSELYSFKTTRTPPPTMKSPPKVSETGETSYQIEWQPVKMTLNVGEKMFYCLQTASSSRTSSLSALTSADDFKTVYKGASMSYTLTGLIPGASYRVKVAAVRCSPDDDEDGTDVETYGAWSPVASFSIPSQQSGQHRLSDSVEDDGTNSVDNGGVATGEWSDRQWAVLILVGFLVLGVLFAVLLQRFVGVER